MTTYPKTVYLGLLPPGGRYAAFIINADAPDEPDVWRGLNEEQAHTWLGQHNYIRTGRAGEYVRLGR